MTQRSIFTAWCITTITLLASLLCLLDQQDQAIAWRTVALGACASAIAIPLGALFAKLANSRGFLASLAWCYCLVGVLVPVFVQVSAWDAAFGKLGLLTNTFGDVLTPLVSRWPAAIWIHAMIAAPQVAIMFLVALRSGSQDWEDALQLEASQANANFKIIQWRFLPMVAAAMLWAMISCAREIGVTDIYQIGTLSEQVYLGYSLGQLNAIGAAWTPEQLAAAQNLGMGISLIVIGWMAMSAIFLFFSIVRSVDQSESQTFARRSKPGVVFRLVGALALLGVTAVPLGNLVGRVGFYVTRIDGEPVATWSYSSAIGALSGVFLNFRDEFVWSILIAAVASTVVSILAIVLVWFGRQSFVGKLLLGMLFGFLASVPGPSIGLFIGKVFSQFDVSSIHYLYDRTIVAPVIANVLFCLPIGIPIFYFLGANVSQDQKQHATVEGVSSWRQLFHFVLVGQWRSNLGAWFLVAALSFGELSATQMVLPPGMDTVPRLALGMLHAGVNESTAALTLVTLIPVILFCIVAQICFALSNDLRVE